MREEFYVYETSFKPSGPILSKHEVAEVKRILKLEKMTDKELQQTRNLITEYFVNKMILSVRPSHFMSQLTAATSVIDVMLCGI